MPSDVIGITNGAGDTTGLGYVTLGGDYIKADKTASYPDSTIVLSGSVFTVTLGTPTATGDLRTDTSNKVATWASFSTVFDTFGNDSTAASVSTTSRVQF